MDTSIQLADVHYINLSNLLTIQACLKTDLVAASYKFHLERDIAIALVRMSAEELRAFASSMPFESLFQPIGNFGELLKAPAPLVPILSTVGARVVTSAQPQSPGDLPV